MSKVDEAIAEIDAALVEVAPVLEGLNDFASLDIKETTRPVVRNAIVEYDRRVQYLTKAREALVDLRNDQYPSLVIPDVDLSALNDLKDQVTTIQAAFSKFHSGAADTLVMTLGEPQPR